MGIDPGSASIGIVIMSDNRDVIDAAPIPYCDEIVDLILAEMSGIDRIVIEYAPWHPKEGASGPALIATQRAWLVGHDMVRDLRKRSAVPIETIGRQSWAHRVVPHHKGGIKDEHVRARLPVLLSAESMVKLADVHTRDAAGAVLGWIMRPEEKPKREPTAPGPRPKRSQKDRPASRSAAWVARKSSEAKAIRNAAGCKCKTKHFRTCPLFKPKKARGVDPLDVLLGLA